MPDKEKIESSKVDGRAEESTCNPPREPSSRNKRQIIEVPPKNPDLNGKSVDVFN